MGRMKTPKEKRDPDEAKVISATANSMIQP
jgi:hypothetical protein